MSDLIATLRAIVRAELARVRVAELGIVSQVYARDGDGSKNNHQVNVLLRGSGVELQRVPVAVSRLGLSHLPNEGDLVVIGFVGGDLNVPVVLGCLYDEQAHPPVAQMHEFVYHPPDDEQSGTRRLHLELKNGSTITVDDDALTITLGGTSVVVNRDGDVALEASGNIQLKAGGDIVLEAQGNVKVSAQVNATIEASASATLQAQAQAKLKGAQVALAGLTQFSPA